MPKRDVDKPRDGRCTNTSLFNILFFLPTWGKKKRKRPQRDISCVIVILQIMVHEFGAICMSSVHVMD